MWVRAAAARGMGDDLAGGGKAVLRQLLADPQRVVQIAAVEACGKLKDREALGQILELTGHDDPDLRKAAILALGEIGEPNVAAKILALLTDHAWRIRCAAALSLGKLRAESAREKLAELAQQDEERLVRQSAAFALEQLNH